MSKPGLSYGINFTKKPGTSKPAPPKRKPIFGDHDDSDDDAQASGNGPQATEIAELDDLPSKSTADAASSKRTSLKPANGAPPQPPNKSKKSQVSVYGDLSSALDSRRNKEAAVELDPSIYDYDGVYDSLKPEKKAAPEDVERRPKYMNNLIASAAVRKRDALIAEEKKIAREREEEGDEFADKEKFVTGAYKKQQEENRRIEEEERRKEEEEAKKNKGGGMTAFYKQVLDQAEQRHAEIVRAAEERAKAGPQDEMPEAEKVKTSVDLAREINEKGGSIAINEDGQVVDKRELLKGGLNVVAKKRPEAKKDGIGATDRRDYRDKSRDFVGVGGKNAMRERQSRMLQAQLEQSLKRSMEVEEEERQKVERASKSRKTESDILGAKERYIARKREAEAAKEQGPAG